MSIKTLLVTVFSIAFYGFTSGQDSNYFEYYSLINQAEMSSLEGEYFQADSFYNAAFNKVDRPFGQDCFLAGVNSVRMDDVDRTQHYLERSFAAGVQWKQVKNDSLYQYLRKHKLVNSVRKSYKTAHKNYMQSLDADFRKQMFLLVKKDQKVRSWRYQKKDWKVQQPIMQKADDENFAELVEICKTKSFPGFRLIGENLTSKYDIEDISLLMRHFTKEKLKELEPYIFEAISTGDIYPWHYGTAYDYSSMFKTTIEDLDEDGNHVLY